MIKRILTSIITIALLAVPTYGQTKKGVRQPQKAKSHKTAKETPEYWKSAYRLDLDMNPVESSNGKHGFVDKEGREVLPFVWNDVGSFSEGLASVMDASENWGYIDTTGKIVIPCKWWGAYEFSEGLAVVWGPSGFGFIDKTGKVVIPCKWKFAYGFYNGVAKVEDNNGVTHIINKRGEIIKQIF